MAGTQQTSTKMKKTAGSSGAAKMRKLPDERTVKKVRNNEARGQTNVTLIALVVLLPVLLLGAAIIWGSGMLSGSGEVSNQREDRTGIEAVYYDCEAWENTDENYIKMTGDDLVLVRIMMDDMAEKKGAMHCMIDALGGTVEFDQALETTIAFTTVGFDFGDYRGVMKLQEMDGREDEAFYLAIFETGADRLEAATEVCNTIFVDRGKPAGSRYSYDSYEAYREAEKAYRPYGSLQLEDNGKTLIYKRSSGQYTDNKSCVYEVVNLPERIRTAMSNTSKGMMRKEEWGDFVVEWGPGEDDFMIYQH